MIVGTAGHVDHGKTSLVRALTGIDTDRLVEEKRRGITIDLGFAYLPGGARGPLGFVDVPGHESLVRTMVAGAAGIDVALLVVAADEGVMPQTREHLAVLDLLGIARIFVAITKSDRADASRRRVVRAEVAATLADGMLGAAEPVFVSVETGEGIDPLRAMLLEAAAAHRPRPSKRIFRLAVDRAFTLNGVGTVVAGTAISGRIGLGDAVSIVPGGACVRVRSLHVQNVTATEGSAGMRCALALAGLPRAAAARGHWVCGELAPHTSLRFDADLRVLPGESRGIGQWTPVHLHCGASDVPARVVALSAQTIVAGAQGFAQIVASEPLPLRHGDRFVLRDTSAQRTIGGGTVVDPRSPKRKRRTPERLARLVAMRASDPVAALRAVFALPPYAEDLVAFAADRSLTLHDAETSALAAGGVLCRDADLVFAACPAQIRVLGDAVVAHLATLHEEHADLPGLAGERLRLLCGAAVPLPVFAAVRDRLIAESRIVARGHVLSLPSHVARLGAEDQRIADLILPLIARDRFRPPRVRDLGADLGIGETKIRQICRALGRTGALVEIARDHFFQQEAIAEMAEVAYDLTARCERFTAAEFRDRLDNGRKVAVQVLEFFDRHGLTRRDADLRRVVKNPALLFGTASAPKADRA